MKELANVQTNTNRYTERGLAELRADVKNSSNELARKIATLDLELKNWATAWFDMHRTGRIPGAGPGSGKN